MVRLPNIDSVGAFENVRTLDEAWAAVEKMLGYAVVPLDPRFIA
jgi:hypothetical protein